MKQQLQKLQSVAGNVCIYVCIPLIANNLFFVQNYDDICGDSVQWALNDEFDAKRNIFIHCLHKSNHIFQNSEELFLQK